MLYEPYLLQGRQPLTSYHALLKMLILLTLSLSPIAQALTFVEAKVGGVNGVSGLSNTSSVVVSPDGNHVYATGFSDNAVVAFSRNANGLLTFVQAFLNSDIQNSVNGLRGPNSIAISPDGRHLYVTSVTDNAVSVFTRNLPNGSLSLVEIQREGTGGIINGLGGANGVAVSPDGTRVYVAASTSNAITAFSRNQDTGALTFLATQNDGVAGVDGLNAAVSIAVSRDNMFIHVSGNGDNAVAVFHRTATSELGFVGAIINNVNGVTGLDGPFGLAVSPDNAHLYVTSTRSNSVVALIRNPVAGSLDFVPGQVYVDGSGVIDGLAGARSVTVNPVRNEVYVTGTSDGALAVFTRTPASGALTFKEVQKAGLSTLNGVTAVDTSPNGEQVYTAALSSNALSVFSVLSTDLALTAQGPANNAPAAINKALAYTFSVTNNGTDAATGVTLTSTLPAGAIFTTATASIGNCTNSNSIVTCNIGNLPDSGSASVVITIQTPGTTGKTLISQTSISSNIPDADTTNNTVTINTPLVASLPTADVQISAKTNVNPVNVSSPLTYTYVVNNIGPDAATETVLTAKLPAGVTFVSADARCTNASNTLTCQLGTLAASSSTDVSAIVTTGAAPITITSTASVTTAATDNAPLNDNTSIDTQVAVLNIDLTLTDPVATPNSISVNNTLTLKVGVANQGNGAATGVTLSTSLPEQFGFVSSSEPRCIANGANVNCDLGTFPAFGNPGTTIDFVVRGLLPKLGIPVTFNITGNGSEPVPDVNPNSKSVNVNVTGAVADLVLTLEDSGSPVSINSDAKFKVTVSNNGPNTAPVTISNTFSGTAALVTNSSNCGTGLAFSCNLGDLAPGASISVDLIVRPTAQGAIKLDVTATSPAFDPTPAAASREVAVSTEQANLKVELTAIPSPALINQSLVYTAKVSNAGPNQASGTVLSFTLPPAAAFVSALPSQGTPCTQNNGVVSCALGPIDNGGNAEVSITVTAQAIGTLSAAAAVSSAIADLQQDNNQVALDVVVSQLSTDLGVTVTDAPDPVLAESLLTYTLLISNAGPDNSSGSTLLFTLPANTALQTTHAEPSALATCAAPAAGSSDVTCSISALANGAKVTLTIATVPNVAGQLTATAKLTGNEFDPVATNNTATVETAVNQPSPVFADGVVRNGINGVLGLNGVNALDISADGRNLYAAGFTSNAIVVFNRTNSGQLTFLQAFGDGLNGVDGLAGASDVVITPDGNHAYATGFSDNAIAIFSRDTSSGALTFISAVKDGLNGVDGLAGAFSIVATNSHIYVAGTNDDAIAIFGRDPVSGALTFSGTIAVPGKPTALAMSTDSTSLISTNANDGSLTVFERNAASGALTQIQTVTEGLSTASGASFSADGRHVYVVGGSNVVVYSRDSATRQLTFVETLVNGTGGINGVDRANDVAISSDGHFAYVASITGSSLAIFRRNNESGRLTFADVIKDGVNGADGLSGARDVALAAGYIYVAGFNDNAIAILRPAGADLVLTAQASAETVQVNETLTYTFSLNNTGPDQATNVQLATTLSGAGIEILSATPTQGNCVVNISDAQSPRIDCALGPIANAATATVTLSIRPTVFATLQSTTTATATQSDPTPNQASLTTNVAGTADLSVALAANPLARVANPHDYTLTVTNSGPNPASNVVVILDTQPAQVDLSGQVNVVNDSQATCEFNDPIARLTCTLPVLTEGISRTINLQLTPTQESITLKHTASVQSTTIEVNPANNQATLSVEVSSNVIETALDNTGATLNNYIIAASGSVTGGNLAGNIVNEGLIADVTIDAGTVVTGGGRLSGTIINNGSIENAQLVSGTIINGGTISGHVSGFPAAPAMLNAVTVAAGAQLSNVIIGLGSTISPEAIPGEGVRFAVDATIPSGLLLNGALPLIIEPVSQSRAYDLHGDILSNASSILAAINAIPEVVNNGLIFSQFADSGYLYTPVGDSAVTLIPVSVTQVALNQPGVQISTDNRVTFTTSSGRQIVTHPVVQMPAALQTALNALGINRFISEIDGNLTINPDTRPYFKARPDVYGQPVSSNMRLGLSFEPSPFINGLTLAVFRFVDRFGITRQQTLWPSPGRQSELAALLRGISGSTPPAFQNNGVVSMRIGARSYAAVYDYIVTPGVGSTVPQLLIVPDQNNDGQGDVRVIYANGDQQLLFVLPLPDLVSEVQAIPDVQNRGYTVEQSQEGFLILNHNADGERLILAEAHIEQVDENIPSAFTINTDNSVTFITETGRRVLMQPVVQDLPALELVLKPLGLQTIEVADASVGGNLTLTENETRHYIARAAPDSKPAADSQPLGLNFSSSGLSGMRYVNLVYSDSTTGAKRQQLIYPAPYSLPSLQSFFSGTAEVIIHGDGMLEVNTATQNFRGQLDYLVTFGNAGSGSIQFNTIADANGDGVADFMVIYENGEQQIIYQRP